MSTPAFDNTARPVELLWSRFVAGIGKTDRFLYEWKKKIIWSETPLTVEIVADHVLGKHRIGVGSNDLVAFGCLDFDGKVKDADGNVVADPKLVEQAWVNVTAVVAILTGLGFVPLVELSRSGFGWHVWLLCDPAEPPTRTDIRRLLRAVLRCAGLPDDGNEVIGHPGIFPYPPAEKNCGRTPFLPWSGLLNGKPGGLFVDADGVPLDRQETALEEPDLATKERVDAALVTIEKEYPEAAGAVGAKNVNAAVSELIKPRLDLVVKNGEHAWPKVRDLAMKLRNHHPKDLGSHLVLAYAEKVGVIERHGLAEVQRVIDTAWNKPPLWVETEFHRTQGIEVTGEWPEVIPLDRGVVPPFPLEVLPDTLKDFVLEVATATRTPLDLAGNLALSAVSTAIQGTLKVCPYDGWTEAINTYTVVALHSGELKGPVYRAVMQPIKDYESAERALQVTSIRDATTRHKVLVAQYAKAERDATVKDEADASDALNRALDLARQVDESKPPAYLRLVVADVTPEKLSNMLQDQRGRLSVLSSEGGIFSNIFGRYDRGKEPKLDAILQAYDAEQIICDRAGREGEYINNPALTFGVAVQPAVLENLMGNKFADEVGLIPRFQLVYPVSLMGGRDGDPDRMDPLTRRNYHNLITKLLNRPVPRGLDGSLEPSTLTLSPEALKQLIALHDKIEPLLKPDGDLAYMKAWLGKMRGKVLRLAAQLHLADDNTGSVISEATFLRAERLGWYYKAHAERCYGVMNANPATLSARIILGWITGKGITSFQVRDLYKARPGPFPTAEAPLPGLKVLTDRGYIRMAAQSKEAIGRNPSPLYEVNPAVVTPKEAKE